MTTDNTNMEAEYTAPVPNPDLRSLDRLVGTWKVSGPDIEGQATYKWMEGGFFLLQQRQVEQGRQHEFRRLGVSRRRRV